MSFSLSVRCGCHREKTVSYGCGGRLNAAPGEFTHAHG